jgi:hypothetical protein
LGTSFSELLLTKNNSGWGQARQQSEQIQSKSAWGQNKSQSDQTAQQSQNKTSWGQLNRENL